MGRSILRGLGTYFEECGSIRERIAGLEGQDAREPRNILKLDWDLVCSSTALTSLIVTDKVQSAAF